MNPAGDFENALRNAVNTAVKSGVHPLLVMGTLNAVAMDVRDSLKQAGEDRKRQQIVRATTLPPISPNGHH